MISLYVKALASRQQPSFGGGRHTHRLTFWSAGLDDLAPDLLDHFRVVPTTDLNGSCNVTSVHRSGGDFRAGLYFERRGNSLEADDPAAEDREEREVFCQRRETLRVVSHVMSIRGGTTRTVKKESPGPKTIEGLMIVVIGSASRNAFSPAAFVL